MTWLRIDDQFASHPKVARLSDREFRVHMRVLCWCAQHRTRGVLTGAYEAVLGLTPAVGKRFLELGLWDGRADGVLEVHDFEHYNPTDPTARERMRRHRDRNKTVTDGVTDRNGDASRGRAGAVPSPSVDPPNPPTGGARVSRRELRRYTGCRLARGTHGMSYVQDVLGTDKPPADWPHEKPAPEAILLALAARNGSVE